jgi:hypothetical protein
MQDQIVKFVVDKELEIVNHFIGVDVYKRNLKNNFPQQKSERKEYLITIDSKEVLRKEIEKDIEEIYKKEYKLNAIASDVNNEWVKIEKEFIKRLEAVHNGNKFPYSSVKGVLSCAGRFGYNADQGWFATDMFRNKFISIDTAMHEIMHFMFHKYYDQKFDGKDLKEEQRWDIKESFSVILNLEFDDLRFWPDNGYSPHKKIRKVIEESWKQNRDFNKALDLAIEFVKSNQG